jgi:tetratricopeptide (TPR) repeat protein
MRAYRPDTYKQVYGFAKGGSVGLDGMMKKYQVGGSNRITDFNSMLGQAPAARPAMIGQPPMREDGLNQMMQQYNVGRTSGSRQDYDQASERLKQAMMSASEETPVAAGPSKAEMYFRLASAFAKPTPTGNFFESLGNAGAELAAYKGDVRAAESAAAQQRRDLAIELAKADVTRARDVMEMESESGLPLSPEGKSAYDEGLVPGTPEFAVRKRQIEDQNNLARLTAANAAPTRMSTTEARAKLDAEREVLQSEIAIDAIKKAIELSPIAYTKSVGDQISLRRARLTDPSNERVVATSLMEQSMTTNVLSSLRAMFGGNVTEGERAIALATQGLNEESPEARTAIFQVLLDIANKRNTYLTSLLQRINTREFMQYDDFVAPESTELTAGQETGVI